MMVLTNTLENLLDLKKNSIIDIFNGKGILKEIFFYDTAPIFQKSSVVMHLTVLFIFTFVFIFYKRKYF